MATLTWRFASVCTLTALLVGALAAQGALAATNGTTGFTCKKLGPGHNFTGAHCAAADLKPGEGEYEHVAIPPNTLTEGRVTNTGVARFRSVSSGVTLELQAAKTEGIANGENRITETGEHYIQGTGATTYKEVTVTAPAGKGCEVEGGEVTTNSLKGTSLGAGMEGKLEPESGTVYAAFKIKGCSQAALNKQYKVEGSIRCPGDGSTVVCTHAATTAQGTLTLGGQKAGVELTTTATGRANSTEPFTPLAATTVETP